MVRHFVFVEELKKNEVCLTETLSERECCSRKLIEIEKTLEGLEKTRKAQLRDLEVTNEKINEMSGTKNELEKKVSDLDLRVKEVKEVISNSTIISVIIVDDDQRKYNLENGLIDANRDIVMKLLRIVGDEMKFKSIIGIGNIFYIWTKQPIFRLVQNAFSFRFLNNGVKHVTNTGVRLVWKSNGESTFFVGTEMTQGLYGITVEKDGPKGYVQFGVAVKRLLHNFADCCLYSRVSGSCCIYSNGIDCGNNQQISHVFFDFSRKAILKLELDCDRHVLYFFIDGVQIPHCIVNVPPAVHFAVSGRWQGTTVKIKSVGKLSTPTVKGSMQCSKYNWK